MRRRTAASSSRPLFLARHASCAGAITLAATLSLVLGAHPNEAQAYRQTKTCLTDEERDSAAPTNLPTCSPGQVGWPVRWPTREVSYWVHKGGHDATRPGENGEIAPSLLRAVRNGVEAWNEEGCSDFVFKYEGLTDVARHFPEDGVNVITWVDDGWAETTATIALTTTTMTRQGELVDADMEFNVRAHRFTITDVPGTGAIDLGNTTTHEAGHMLGLDEAPHEDATMYYSAAAEETKKRTLHADDIAGLCAIYPVGVPPVQYGGGEPPEGTCPDGEDCTSDGGCCATTAPSGTGDTHLLLGLAGALLVGVGRRRARRASAKTQGN